MLGFSVSREFKIMSNKEFSSQVYRFFYRAIGLPFLTFLFLLGCLFRTKLRRTLKIHLYALKLFKTHEQNIQTLSQPYSSCFWFHVSSVGEFLQALPVIKKLNPNQNSFIFLTYFSPSLEVYIKSKGKTFQDFNVTYACPYPWDFHSIAKRLVNLVPWKSVTFTKFDLWPELIWQCSNIRIPPYWISATLNSQSKRFFFRRFFSDVFSKFQEILCVSQDDKQGIETILNSSSRVKISVTGDTRLDSVVDSQIEWLQNSQKTSTSQHFENLKTLIQQSNRVKSEIFAFGSLWPSDLEFLEAFCTEPQNPFKTALVVPHEITQQNQKRFLIALQTWGFQSVESISGVHRLTYSKSPVEVIFVPQIGILSGIYSLANATFVGCGPGGVHNTLEPAAWENAVFLGPRFSNAPEVKDLIARKAAISFANPSSFRSFLRAEAHSKKAISDLGRFARMYLEENRGSSLKCAIKLQNGTV
jgi:3-deoxy-D-manno-octulosonic-acid transferase